MLYSKILQLRLVTFYFFLEFSNHLIFQKVQLCQLWDYPIKLFLKVQLMRNNGDGASCGKFSIFKLLL